MTLHYRYELQHAVGVHLSWHQTLSGAIQAAHEEAVRLGLKTGEYVDYPSTD